MWLFLCDEDHEEAGGIYDTLSFLVVFGFFLERRIWLSESAKGNGFFEGGEELSYRVGRETEGI